MHFDAMQLRASGFSRGESHGSNRRIDLENSDCTDREPMQPHMLRLCTSVLICGRFRMLLEGLAARLMQDSELQVEGVVADIEAASPEISAQVVIFEVDSPTWPAEALARVRSRFPDAKLVVLLTHSAIPRGEPESGVHIVRASEPISRLVDAVRATSTAWSPVLQRPEPGQPADPSEAALAELTPQQREIFIRLARGDSVKEIARALQATFKAVDCQKYRIMRKLGLNDRVQATRLAIRVGLLTP
jgi:DNA-binding NarL/FixJ family response regulator